MKSDNSKPYSPILDGVYDKKGKMIVLDFMTSTGLGVPTIPLDKQPERFKAFDSSYYAKNGKVIKIEAKVKYPWGVSGAWQMRFPTLDIEGRSLETECDWLFMSNRFQDTLAVVLGDNIRLARERHQTYRKDTRNPITNEVTKDELFGALPLDYVKFYYKINGTWKRITATGQLFKKG